MCYHRIVELINLRKADIEQTLKRLSSALRGGKIVAFPTETFYALGVKYDQPAAVKRLFALKDRPSDKALPLIIGNTRLLSLIAAEVPPMAKRLMDQFWPGPLTLVLRAKETLSPLITAGSGTVAVRIPGSSFALTLAMTLGFPITATSANISSLPPADSAKAVSAYFGDTIDFLIDGGTSPGMRPSTIVDATKNRPVILRQGPISAAEIVRAAQA